MVSLCPKPSGQLQKTSAFGCVVGLSLFVLPLGPALAVSPTINVGANLNFGQFIASTATGTVQIRVNDTRVVGGGVSGAAGTISAGVLQVSGNGNPIVLTISPTSVTLTGPGTNMTVDTFQVETSAGGPTQTVTPAATTTLDVPIGATLHVGSNQTAGSYSGSFTIDATFQ